MQEFVVFEIAGIDFIDLERLHHLREGRYDKKHQTYQVEADDGESARKKVAESIFDDANRGADGVWNIIDMALEGLMGLALCGDEDLFEYLGPVDGSIARALYDNYTLDRFVDREIHFSDLSDADQELFAEFDASNLKKLFVNEVEFYLVAIPITKTIK